MKQVSEVLENISDNTEVFVTFDYGDCFGLSDFEMVDESIYERSDMCLSDIVSIIKVARNVYSTENKLEFSVNDVLKVEDTVNGHVLYHREK